MTVRRIQAPHRMKCENCDVGFVKLVKTDELINGKKHCVYYCEHCKNYQLYEQVEHQPKRFTEHSVFEGKDAEHYQRWINQIKKYVEEDNPDFTYNNDFIIKIALSYTLQSVRNGESLKGFQWDDEEFEICEKGHIIYPNDCDDFERTKSRYNWND